MAEGGSLKNKIYNAVLSNILTGVYTQETILSEKRLIEEFHVSKSPVRDALIELCNEGVLKSIPRYGYELVRITEADIRNIMDYRVMLECGCLRIATQKMSDGQIDELERYTRESCCVPDEVDIWRHWDNNIRFHLRLNSYAQNQFVYDKLQSSMNIMTRAYAQFHWDRWHKMEYRMGIEGHLKIVEQLRARNADAAAECLRQDILEFMAIIIR